MKKIPTLFVRDEQTRLVRNIINEGCEWVFRGEGMATIKYDGSCCMVRDGKLYKRYDAKHGKTPPPDFEPAQEPDPITGHWPGWVPVGDEPIDRYHREAWENLPRDVLNWTYELVGPRLQGNPYELEKHMLYEHGTPFASQPPRDSDGLRAFLSVFRVEGIVWWRDTDDPDCDKAKIKRKDFGLPWPVKQVTP